MTRALRSYHVWRMRRLEFKGAFVDVRDACEQCVNVVGGRSFVFVHAVPNCMSLVSHVFSMVVFMFVGMCSYDKTLCGFWWECVDSDRSFPATRSLRCSVCYTSVCL